MSPGLCRFWKLHDCTNLMLVLVFYFAQQHLGHPGMIILSSQDSRWDRECVFIYLQYNTQETCPLTLSCPIRVFRRSQTCWACVEPFILISIYLGGLVQWVIIHLNLIKSASWVLWLRISRLKEEVEVRGRHVPPLIDGPVHGSPLRYLHLIWVNELHWLQESAVTNAGMELRHLQMRIFLIYFSLWTLYFLITSHITIKTFVFVWWVNGDLRPFQEIMNLSIALFLMCRGKVNSQQLSCTPFSTVFQE